MLNYITKSGPWRLAFLPPSRYVVQSANGVAGWAYLHESYLIELYFNDLLYYTQWRAQSF